MALSMRLGRNGPAGRRIVGPHADDGSEADRRHVLATLGLPTGRALVGGLLVAVAALGIFAAHEATTAVHLSDFLIVSRSVAPGTRLDAEDLALAPMDLYSSTRAQAITNPDEVIGRVALVPLNEGDLLLRSSTVRSVNRAATPGRRVGLALDSSHALGGELAIGDRVDVVTVPRAEDPATIIVRGAIVTSVGGDVEASVGSSEHLRVNLDVPTEEDARLVIEARARGGVTLIGPSTLSVTEPAE